MANAIHISQARKILSSGKPCSLRVLDRKGQVLELHNCVGLKYDFYEGVRRIKLLESRQIRQIRDCLILEINDYGVYL